MDLRAFLLVSNHFGFLKFSEQKNEKSRNVSFVHFVTSLSLKKAQSTLLLFFFVFFFLKQTVVQV